MAIKEQNTEKLTTEEVTKLNELRITSSELEGIFIKSTEE